MDVSFDTIFGVRVGFEFVPADVAQAVFGEEYRGGIMIDLFIFNIMLMFK
jgi:hypothetical protein